MSHPSAHWSCYLCGRLLGEIEYGRLRLSRSVEVVYVVTGGVAVCCPRCDEPRIWRDAPMLATSAPGT